MKKYGYLLSMVLVVLSIAIAAASATITCKVESVTGNTVILNCGDKAATLKPGDTIKVRSRAKLREPLLGC